MDPRRLATERYQNNPQQVARDGVTGYFAVTGAAIRWAGRRAGLTPGEMPARSFSAFRRQLNWSVLRTPIGRFGLLAGAMTVGARYGINRAIGTNEDH